MHVANTYLIEAKNCIQISSQEGGVSIFLLRFVLTIEGLVKSVDHRAAVEIWEHGNDKLRHVISKSHILFLYKSNPQMNVYFARMVTAEFEHTAKDASNKY
jgi:hypothetical protein